MEQEWSEIRDHLQAAMPRGQFDLWVATLEFLGIKEQRLILGCRSQIHIEWLHEKLEQRLLQLTRQRYPEMVGLDYQLMPPVQGDNKDAFGDTKPSYRQIELKDVLLNPVNQLNRRFTFDHFVVGSCNQFAHAASLAMAGGQQLYHPFLYLFSDTGLGKSHLSHAVGNHLRRQQPATRVQYATAEQFANEMIFSLKKDQIETFKQRYRTCCDVLILERVEFLSGKEKIQNELMCTLDELMDRGKRILCTGNAYPKDIPRLSPELRSRLSGVLVAPIERPDFKTRMEIVQRKSSYENVPMPMEVTEFLASRITHDVRQLESCIVGVIAKSTILGVPVTINLAEEVTKTMLDQLPKLTVEHIQQIVCSSLQLTLEELISPSRRKELVNARKIGMYLCRNYTTESLATIGKAFNRTHSSVLHAVSQLSKEMEEKNNKLRRQVEHIGRRLETSCLHTC
jgi:chromosomal replication initiator protein